MSVAMTFGKYRGKRLPDIPVDYLRWCLRECTNLRHGMRTAIEDELDRRSTDGAGSVDVPNVPVPVAHLEGVITKWYREMSLRFHPDRGGSHEHMVAINIGMERLRELAGESMVRE